jgi:hypothetical protein
VHHVAAAHPRLCIACSNITTQGRMVESWLSLLHVGLPIAVVHEHTYALGQRHRQLVAVPTRAPLQQPDACPLDFKLDSF